MKTLVYDVAASESGALSILEEFYDKYRNDKENQYVFVISTPELESTDNIQVLRYPWIKKSWLHRWWFDHFYAPRIVKEYQIDKVFSLQNVLVPLCNIEQELYLHQPLPFVEYRFNFNENKLFWIYQHIIGRQIKKSVKKASKVIVQTNWMKEACIKQVGADSNKIDVQQPKIDMKMIIPFVDTPEHRKNFFYPATPLEYKNHMVILEAFKMLQDEGITNYKITFTFNGDESEYAKKLYSYAQQYDLKVTFAGKLSREEVFKMYSKSVLLFPSLIETFGMPLLEARLSGTPIIARDTSFAKEILKDYGNVMFANTGINITAKLKKYINVKKQI